MQRLRLAGDAQVIMVQGLRSRFSIAAIVVVLLLGAGLRLPDIRLPLWDSFSWREASTAMMADNFLDRSWNVFYPEVNWTGPGPSYQGREFQIVSYLAAVINKVRGWRDWHGRLVAVLFGFWTLVAFYLLSREVLGDRKAWAPAAALALMPGTAFIDRSFLPEPAMLALTTTGLWLLLMHLKTGRLSLLVLAGLSTSLGILAKLPGISVLAVMGWLCWTELRQRKELSRKRVVPLAVALVLILLPVVVYYRWTVSLGMSHPPYHVAGHGYLIEDPVGFFRNGFYLAAFAGHQFWLIGFPLLLLAAVGLLSPSEDGGERYAFNLFGAWLAGVAALFLFAAKEMTTNPWNLATFCLPVAGFAGLGWLKLARLGERPGSLARNVTLNVAVGAVLFCASLFTLAMMKAPHAYVSWELGSRLQQLSAPDDLVVTAAVEIGNPVAVYYSRRRGWVFPPGGLCPPGGPTTDRDWSLLEDDARALRRVEALRGAGAGWFGFARSAKDSAGRLFVNHNQGVIAYLRTVAVFVEETDKWLIYKLPPVPPGKQAEC